uniref:Ig-like domain-containing protein n=1 Tax=Pygocentrus nattereri TaxID=42514 RepID=A0AAR2K9E5_PYGNA
MMRGELVLRIYWILSAVRYIQGSRPHPDEEVPQIVHHPSDVVVRVGSPATLSCRAEGNPEPSIQWLRNGVPLEPEKMEGQSRPIILPEGSLFFLSVVPGRKSQSHEAVYACVARNSAGTATSRNASLHIAGGLQFYISSFCFSGLISKGQYVG